MFSILLTIIGCSIILCGIFIAILAYTSRQEFISFLSDKYMGDLGDDDIVPNEIVIKLVGRVIQRVLLVIFSVLLIETAGFALLVVSSVI
jgi:hypothetical protein